MGINSKEAELRQAIMERSGGLCEGVLDGRRCFSPGDWRGLAIHEVVFRSRGGKRTLENTRFLCAHCHSLSHGIIEH